SKFARVFARAGEMGLRRVAHAGEEGPPAYVHEALDLLHIDRLDHGNRALEDSALTAPLARSAMTLTVCPLSNLKLCVVHDIAARLKESEWTPDVIIGLGRGGLIPAVYLSHATGISMVSVDHSSQLPDFAAELLIKLAIRSMTDRLLFVDDINDSGRTFTH